MVELRVSKDLQNEQLTFPQGNNFVNQKRICVIQLPWTLQKHNNFLCFFVSQMPNVWYINEHLGSLGNKCR